MKYFKNIETLEELKKAYKKLALKLHPDVNKDQDTTEQFKEMQNEYEIIFEQVKNKHKNAQGTIYEKATEETMNEFKDIINSIIGFKDCTIDIIGSWVWVAGNTKEYKDILKGLKFRWIKSKSAWAFHKEPFRKRTKKEYSINDLKEMFGSVSIKIEEKEALNA